MNMFSSQALPLWFVVPAEHELSQLHREDGDGALLLRKHQNLGEDSVGVLTFHAKV